VARGLIDGNPVYGMIMERRPEALKDIKRAVASRIATELGDHPVQAHLRALVFSATRAREVRARGSPVRVACC
jgi:hypothetical protein